VASRQRVKISELLRVADPATDVAVTSLEYDSRKVHPGALFFCVPGFKSDGHDFADAAISAGAEALVVERQLSLDCPQIVVSSVREAMAVCADRFYGSPSHKLKVFGVTGTNGKTTVTTLVQSLLETLGVSCGLIGTIKSTVGGEDRLSVRTTPESIDLQSSFREMLELGDKACAIEISSHALSLHRATGIRFEAAVFTNLTQDHLDFHGSMEEYYLAKRKLFQLDVSNRVVNIDDQFGQRLYKDFPDAATVSVKSTAEYRANSISTTVSGTEFSLLTDEGSIDVKTPLIGMFNVYNTVCAIAALHRSGFVLDQLVQAAADLPAVPGRMQPVDVGQSFAVFVDYAHTPDSLESVLATVKALTTGKVISLFGCGGDRDQGKRSKMGAISDRYAEYSVITSDNPRSEDPEQILKEIASGFASSSSKQMHLQVDRRTAIFEALSMAEAGDTVVIAGKGHEQGQEFANQEKIPFDDVEEVKLALGQLVLEKDKH